ncbi:MAG: hypothetical protein ACE5HO_09730 [bacterium]
MEKITANKEMRTTIRQIFKDAGISSEYEALVDRALLITLGKITKYKTEIDQFQKKYQTTFEDFEKRLLNQKNDENFEVEDDFLDWRFAEEALRIWEKRRDILYHV